MADVNMVLTRTPLRVSFLGGGSDMLQFYGSHGPGQVVSLALNKYIYVAVKRHAPIFNEKYRLSYSKNEIVDSVDDIENNIIRECIRFSGIEESLYVSTFSDIPAASGLGSSSALAVGLLNALHGFKKEAVTRSQIAEEACHVEIDVLKKPIGKQDQYAAAFGGLNKYSFYNDNRVSVEGLNLSPGYLEELLGSGTLYWTGLTRQVETILLEQKTNFLDGKVEEVSAAVSAVSDFTKALEENMPIIEIAGMINQAWELKKRFANTISSSKIDEIIEELRQAGGIGGKLCGGGGGGFVLMFHDIGMSQALLENSQSDFAIPLGMDFSGSEMLMVS